MHQQGIAPNLATHLITVHAGHHHIKDKKVRLVAVGKLEAFNAIISDHDLMAVNNFQGALNGTRNQFIIINH